MTTTRTPRLLALVTVGTLAFAACGGSGSSDAEACDAAQKVSDAFEEGNAAETAEDARAALGDFAQALADFAEAAPDEIRADAELLADGTQQLADVPEGEQPSAEVMEILGDSQYDEAGDRLDEYLLDSCDIEL